MTQSFQMREEMHTFKRGKKRERGRKESEK